MTIEQRAGRIVAVLFLAQMAGSAFLNFRLEPPLLEPPGLLVNTAFHMREVGAATILGLLLGALLAGASITAFPLVRAHSEALALWLLALGIADLALAAVEQASLLSMASLGRVPLDAATGPRELFDLLRVVVSSARSGIHDFARFLDGATLFTLYLSLTRFSLVPRALAVVGLVATVLQLVGIGVAFFGRDVIFPLLAPMGLAQLALCGWLLTNGFSATRLPSMAGRQSAPTR